MELNLLKKHIDILKSSKDEIVNRWCEAATTIENLTEIIEVERFKKEYARGVIEHYISVIEGKNALGDCPIIKKFLKYCSQKDVLPHRLYLICAGFKKAIITLFLNKNLLDETLLEQISYVTDRNLAGVLELYRDIIHNKNIKISSQKNWLKQYIGVINSSLIVSTTDPKGIITHVNKNFCDISGYTREELVGKPHSIIRHPDSPKELFEELWSTIKSNKPWVGVIKNRKKDGSAYYVNTLIFPLKDTDGKVVEYMSTRIDITELFTLQEEKKKSDEMMVQHSKMIEMGEMLGMITHQWKQPLSIISLYSTMIQEDLSMLDVDTEHIRDKIAKIFTQIEMLSQIINDFRDFYKPDTHKKIFKACELSRDVYKLIEAKMKKLGVNFVVEEHKHFDVCGYPNDFKQVMLNIYSNACDKFEENRQKNPTIELSFLDDENTGKIIVKDNGGGIPEELLPDKLFENYVTTKGEKGTGIGLKLCKNIIENKMNGKIYASNKEGGAVFTIELPIYKE